MKYRLTNSVLSRCGVRANFAARSELSLAHGYSQMREAFIPRIAAVTPRVILNFVAEKALGLPRSYRSRLREHIGRKHDDSAHRQRGVNTDQGAGVLVLETPLQDEAAEQRRQHDQGGADCAEGGGALLEPARWPAQCEREKTKPAEAADRVQRGEPPGNRRGGFAAQMHKREPRAEQHGARENNECGDQHGRE